MVKKRTMKDKIKLALASGPLNQRQLYEYICNNLDADAAMITVYLSLRSLIKEGSILKVGDEYFYKKSGSNLL